jgi:hypothetical protein
LFHVPQLELKGWGFSREAAPARFTDVLKIGPVLYTLKMMIFNSLLSIVVPQAILTYTLLYWIMPKFFDRKKKSIDHSGGTCRCFAGLLFGGNSVQVVRNFG